MAKFRFTADAVIEAEDLDDAFLMISDHFTSMRLHYEHSPLDGETHSGTLQIVPLKETVDG